MSAINKNIVCENRNRLEDVIPLSTPYTLAIDPCNLCNFECSFCAIQSKKIELPFQKTFMPYDLFVKIIDDINEFPEKLKVLRINGQGEPLLNPDICKMISYAKTKDIAEYIEIITNGSRLNPTLNQELIDSGIDRIRISIESLDENGYYEVAKTRINYDNFLKNIEDLHNRSGNCEIYCKIVDSAVPTEEDRNKFYEMYGKICDRYFIDNIIPLWSDFDELTDKISESNLGRGVHGQKIKQVVVCPYSFYSLIINSDGEVTLCCADWKREYVIGNLKNESLLSIWNGDKIKKFWINLLEGKKDMYTMCKKCLLPMYDCNDNIDEYAGVIKERLIKLLE